MKTIQVNLYTASELKAQFPAGFARALKHWRDDQTEIFWADEICASFKAVFEAIPGVDLANWQVGAYGHNFAKVVFHRDEVGEFTGRRALAWLENDFLARLRLPWDGAKRWQMARYGAFYRPGMIKPCPLTGYCSDEDFIDSLKRDIASGMEVKTALENLAVVCGQLLEREVEDMTSEENFKEHARAYQLEFTADGEIY